MTVAVSYLNEEIFQHFGHTEQFKLYHIENDRIINSEIISTNDFGHGALADFLKLHNVEILICGGIGGGAQTALNNVGIKFYGGVTGNADEAVAAYLSKNLVFNPNIKCNHHGENHKCDGLHDGGNHKCKSSNCENSNNEK